VPHQKENELTQQNPFDKRLVKALAEDPDTAAIMALMKLGKKQWPSGSAAFVRAQFLRATELAAASLEDVGYLCATAYLLRARVAIEALEAHEPPRKKRRCAAAQKGASR
jgi:hypothetical protein